jgi:hypothetical protein
LTPEERLRREEPRQKLFALGAVSIINIRLASGPASNGVLQLFEDEYIIGENDPVTPEFKVVYYNGKTRQNT